MVYVIISIIHVNISNDLHLFDPRRLGIQSHLGARSPVESQLPAAVLESDAPPEKMAIGFFW